MSDLWTFLGDSDNRAVLSWLGGGLVVAAGGLWAVVKFVLKRKDSGGSTAPGAPGTPGASLRADRGGLAVGGDVHINSVTGLSGPQVVLLIVFVLGAVLLAGGLFGDRISADGGAAAGGDIKNSTIFIKRDSGTSAE